MSARHPAEGGISLGSNEQISSYCAAVLAGGPSERRELGDALRRGHDVLGDAYMSTNRTSDRRASGCTYTPLPLVREMVELAASRIDPTTVIDCGCGSGRFALECARAFPRARVLAVDSSELACAMCDANAVAAGLSERIETVCSDFTELARPRGAGRVLWVGNPPYVRHHAISPERKRWFKDACEGLGTTGSGLAGLHAHFLAHIAQCWHEGDYGMLVLSAEWLDVNYGASMRWLLSGTLGLDYLRLFDRRAELFSGTQTTATVIGFGSPDDEATVIDGRGAEKRVELRRLRTASRWSPLLFGAEGPRTGAVRDDAVPLGTLARVHRGVVTGNNAFWVRGKGELGDIPESLTTPVVSHARELTGECVAQSDPDSLKRLIVIPETLEDLDDDEAAAARSIIDEGRRRGVDEGYVARHRKAWWAVRPPEAPAILMTYMGRRSPTFVVNARRLPMLNVVHGIYPLRPLSDKALSRLVDYLNENVRLDEGRMYCGGLVKFEPREAEAIPVPPLSVLEA